MCGIFGMVVRDGVLSRERRSIGAALLAAYNEQRGDHSWGLAAWRGGQTRVERGLHSPVQGAVSMARETTWLGHSRFATVGEKTLDNAHPFRFGHIIGAHNGAVYNHEEVGKAYGRTFAVDSMHIFAHLAEGLPFGELRGYGAIEYLDANVPDSVFLARLRMGDLTILGIGRTVGQVRGVLWSSDLAHAWSVADALGLECFNYKLEDGAVYEARRDGLYLTPRKVELARPEFATGCAYTGAYTAAESAGESWRDEAWKRAAHERGREWLAGKHDDKASEGRDAAAAEQAEDADVVKLLAEELDEEDGDYKAWLDDMSYMEGAYLDPTDPETKRRFVREAAYSPPDTL